MFTRTLAMITALSAASQVVHAEHGRYREGHLVSADAPYVRVWEPAEGLPKAVLVCLHGIQSNSCWFEPLGKDLAARGIAVWAYDRPNRQMEPGAKPVADVKSKKEWLQQLDRVGQAARITGVPLIAVGVSWGARPVVAGAIQAPRLWDGVVLLNPAFKTRKDGRFLWRSLLAGGGPLSPDRTFAIPLEPPDYTDHCATVESHLQPKQLTTDCTNRFFWQTFSSRHDSQSRMSELRQPILALLGGADPLVVNGSVAGMVEKAPHRTIHTLAGGTHCQLLEIHREVARELEVWLTNSFPRKTPKS